MLSFKRKKTKHKHRNRMNLNKRTKRQGSIIYGLNIKTLSVVDGIACICSLLGLFKV